MLARLLLLQGECAFHSRDRLRHSRAGRLYHVIITVPGLAAGIVLGEKFRVQKGGGWTKKLSALHIAALKSRAKSYYNFSGYAQLSLLFDLLNSRLGIRRV